MTTSHHSNSLSFSFEASFSNQQAESFLETLGNQSSRMAAYHDRMRTLHRCRDDTCSLIIMYFETNFGKLVFSLTHISARDMMHYFPGISNMHSA